MVKRNPGRKPWTTGAVRWLKTAANGHLTAPAIAKAMGRTPAAVYQKASLLKLSLGGGRGANARKKV